MKRTVLHMEKEYTKRILVTGGFGFIGSHIVRHLVNEHKDWYIFNLDCQTYAGNPDNVRDFEDKENYTLLANDIRDATTLGFLFDRFRFTDIIHLAAESHVDNSITGPRPFIETNIVGTFNLLEEARKHWGNEPGHDFRYSINNSKIKNELGWKPKVSLIDAVSDTVDWYLNNQEWVENLKKRNQK